MRQDNTNKVDCELWQSDILVYRLGFALGLLKQIEVGLDVRTRGVFAASDEQGRARQPVVTPQHVGITLVVEDLRRRSNEFDGLPIGAVGKIKSAQAIIRR